MTFKNLFAGIAVALIMPFAASAATVTSSGVSGDPLAGAGTIDVIAGGSYGIVFDDSDDGAGELNFLLENGSSSGVWVQITTTINQGLGYGFADGVSAWLDGDMGMFVAENQAGFSQVMELIAANSTFAYDLVFGDPGSNQNADPFINVVVIGDTLISEVPIPAAGFLLIGALGGLVALRRRKA